MDYKCPLCTRKLVEYDHHSFRCPTHGLWSLIRLNDSLEVEDHLPQPRPLIHWRISKHFVPRKRIHLELPYRPEYDDEEKE